MMRNQMKNKNLDKKNARDGTSVRLDAIIRLMMDTQRKLEGNITLTNQVLCLHSVGLTDTEIGNIIGYKRKNVAAIRTKAKKVKKE